MCEPARKVLAVRRPLQQFLLDWVRQAAKFDEHRRDFRSGQHDKSRRTFGVFKQLSVARE
jgi:hypothetical protein